MTAALMVYSVLVGFVLLAGAGVAGALLRRWGYPERAAWAGALLAACVLPWVQPFLRLRLPGWGGAPIPASVEGLLGVPRIVAVPGPVTDPAAGPWLVAGWLLASLACLAWIAAGVVRLRRARRTSRPLAHSGQRVFLTDEVGPAVTGVASTAILLPPWFGELPASSRRWVLRHEIAHVRGRDLLLQQAALISRVLLPWNPAVWILSRRLLRALETDCDRRVLRRRPDHRGYGETLLAVAARAPAPLPALGAFGAHLSSLEHRIRTMTIPRRPLTPKRVLLLVLAIPAALVVACEMPTPSPTAPLPDPVPEEVTPVRADQLRAGPDFTPYTVAPDITNRAEVVAELERAYPEELREEGIGGTANIWFFINDEGVVEDLRVQRSSGHPDLDGAALQVARAIRFTPALNRDEPVPVWVAFPITFAVR